MKKIYEKFMAGFNIAEQARDSSIPYKLFFGSPKKQVRTKCEKWERNAAREEKMANILKQIINFISNR